MRRRILRGLLSGEASSEWTLLAEGTIRKIEATEITENSERKKMPAFLFEVLSRRGLISVFSVPSIAHFF